MTQTPDAPAPDTISGWAIVELMGHRRLAGLVTETLLAGVPFLRIDIPSKAGGPSLTQYYPPGSLYCLTPCSEAAARAVAKSNQPEPVHYFELPGPRRRTDDDDEIPEPF